MLKKDYNKLLNIVKWKNCVLEMYAVLGEFFNH
jgi:hypothetical protein